MKNFLKAVRQIHPYRILFAAVLLFFSSIVYPQGAIQTDVPALKDVYANDFYIGCLLSYRYIGFANDPYVQGQSAIITPDGGSLIKYHMNSMTPGNYMKPQYTVDIYASASAYNHAASADKDSVDTHPVVRFNGDMIAQLNWAQRQGFTFRGHTLVWYNQTPGTAFFRTGYSNGGARLSKEKMTERMENYIGEVIRTIHEGWPGLLSAIDVVNEAVNDNGTDRSSNNEWYTTFGDNSYIMKAFEFARKYTEAYGETQIKLYYNDYNTHNSSKADGIVRLCTPIFQAGLLDGIGMQDHDDNNYPTAEQWIASYDKFDPICTEMAVTEFEVGTNSANPSATELQRQANQYGQLFKCFVERSYFSGRGKIITVAKDGLNDQYTMKSSQASSLWTAQNQCKPAFYAAVAVGNHYNALDSLFEATEALGEGDYTPESWYAFTVSLTAAEDAMARNYSVSNSAADALEEARENLEAAIANLEEKSTEVFAAQNNVPNVFALNQNYPNPFNPVTTITYSVPATGRISIKIFNLMGDEMSTLFEGIQTTGNHQVTFDASDLVSGIYFCQMKADHFISTKRLVLTK